MKDIDRLRNIDDEIFECFQTYLPLIFQSDFKKKFPATFQIFIDYDVSITFIKNGILDCADSDNIISLKILIRSLVEHYLRYKYVFVQWVNSQSDEPAEKYIIFSSASDQLSNAKAMISEFQLHNPTFKFEKWSEILNQYSKAEIEKEANNFTYKNIVRFLIKSLKKDTKDGDLNFYSSLVNEYSRLSSYVHGGISAHNEIREMSLNFKHLDSDILRLTTIGLQASSSVKLFTLLALQKTDNDKYLEYYKRVSYLISKI